MVNKRVIFIFAIFSLLLGLIPNNAFAYTETTSYGGSSGSNSPVSSTSPLQGGVYENMGRTNVQESSSGIRIDTATTGDIGTVGENTSGDDEDEECFKKAGALGWMMCPVIKAVASFSNYLYQNFVEPQLEIKANEILQNGGATQQAWSSFRDIANYVFIAMFIVIIFSQLTGFGIDNYGIKRMLPRLIIAAILINLSFFICQLAVDSANIVGVAIKGFFNSIQTAGTTLENATGNGSTINKGEYVFALGADILICVIAVFAAAAFGGVLLILGTAIGIFISLIFIFAILVARQAVVVILVVISPLALALYLFPNTESISKRWLKAFEGILLLYPICSFVIASGQLAGGILANAANGASDATGAGMLVAAMLVHVVPYFAIPTLVKNSMSGIGNIGAKIAGVGAGLGNSAKKGVNNSNVMRRAQTKLNSFDPVGKTLGKTRVGRAVGLASRYSSRQAALSKQRSDDVSNMTETFVKMDAGALEERLNNVKNKRGAGSVDEANALANALVAKGGDGQVRLAKVFDDESLPMSTRNELADNLLSNRDAMSNPMLSELAKANASGNTKKKGRKDVVSDAITGMSAEQLTRVNPKVLSSMSDLADGKHLGIMQGKIREAQASSRIMGMASDEHTEVFNEILQKTAPVDAGGSGGGSSSGPATLDPNQTVDVHPSGNDNSAVEDENNRHRYSDRDVSGGQAQPVASGDSSTAGAAVRQAASTTTIEAPHDTRDSTSSSTHAPEPPQFAQKDARSLNVKDNELVITGTGTGSSRQRQNDKFAEILNQERVRREAQRKQNNNTPSGPHSV